MAAFAPNGQPFALLSFSKCRYASDARGARSAVAAQTGPERSNGEAERSNPSLQWARAPGHSGWLASA